MKKSSLHSGHVMACGAYLVGYDVLKELFFAFGVFEFMLPEMGIEFGFTRMFVNERTAAINACRGGACSAYAFANYLVPLAIVWGLVPRLFDGPVFASAVHPRKSRFVHLVGCLVLVVLCAYYVVGPLFGLWNDNTALFDYAERWEYFPGVALAQHLGYFGAACLASRHTIRMRE